MFGPLVPGQWYIAIQCFACKEKHILFPDLTAGKSKLSAFYKWKCPMCGHVDKYRGEALERFQHQSELESVD